MPDPSERTWQQLSREAKFDLILGAVPQAEREAVTRAVREHFEGRPMDDPMGALNVVLRESSRQQHGTTMIWDRAAAAGGLVIR